MKTVLAENKLLWVVGLLALALAGGLAAFAFPKEPASARLPRTVEHFVLDREDRAQMLMLCVFESLALDSSENCRNAAKAEHRIRMASNTP